jgi:hypothetical protein
VQPGQNRVLGNANPDTAENASAFVCSEVAVVRYAGLNVTQGNVHVGGALGGACTPSAPPLSLNTTPGSYGEFIASSADAITNFGSGNTPTGRALTFSNLAGSPGYYGIVCRPDLAKVAAGYLPSSTITPTGGSSATFDISNPALVSGYVYQHDGPLTIVGGTLPANKRITVYNKNGAVTITGDIRYPAGAADIRQLSSFGLITDSTSNVFFSNNVKVFSGFISANGYIDTCVEHGPVLAPSHSTTDCQNQLTVFGSFVANKLYLFRSGTKGAAHGTYENGEVIRQSSLIYLAPPPAFENQTNTSYSLPKYQGERPPLY